MDKIDEISVFFPAYNEQENIAKTLDQAVYVLDRIAAVYEIIVVNDGSSDETAQIVDGYVAQDPHIRMITHLPNQGYGAALKSGLYASRYRLICYTDADGQFDFSEIGKFLDKITGCDMVVGYRLKRQEGLVRQFNAKAWTGLMRLLFNVRARDVDCGFKLLKKKVIDTIPRLEANGAMVSAELLAKAQRAHFKIVEVPVHHYPRMAGHPTGANIQVILRAFRELIKLWGELR
ncbi:glycosyltransferase family 2 protein [Candidatus Daviesbacteria bacterium]|nr:glycosyltransferase family 2 protein [Candidatus Daviesbacteria bacterium]